MKAPDPHAFRSGRLFAAWLGLTPKDHSTAGKTRLGKITRAGDERLRQLLVVGATSVVKQAKAKRPRAALADRAPEAQAAEACGGGACQQDGPHRLEADDNGRELRLRADRSQNRCPTGKPPRS